jgi:hypothetical protein
MKKIKPRLLPVSVPWQISPSVPHLKVQKAPEQHVVFATFIGHFKCDEAAHSKEESPALEVVVSVPEFESTSILTKAPFRMVRVDFGEEYEVRMMPAYSDSEVLPEKSYGWDAVPGALLPNETVDENLRRTEDLWLRTEICPDPGMYEVQNPPWLAEIPEERSRGLRHYVILGHDEYVEILAKAWNWKLGQPVS